MHTITLEFLRHGPAHGQLLSPLTNYLALCGNHAAVSVKIPFDHGQLLHRLHALEYQSDERSREFQLVDTAQILAALFDEVPGLASDASRLAQEGEHALHLRLIISAAELALIPFELADAPGAFPGGASSSLLLQSPLPVCLTREVRRVVEEQFKWPKKPRILFIAAHPQSVGAIPFEAHLLALRRELEPWISASEGKAREDEVAEYLTVLPEADIDQIQRACAEASYTHVHILAHGIGYTVGEDKRFGIALHARPGSKSDRDTVSGPRLAGALRTVRQPAGQRLACPAVVTLACCDAGNVGGVINSVAGAGSSVAHALHGSGIPVVVASQFPLTFVGSVLMVEVLYRGLLHGQDPRMTLIDLRKQLQSRIEQRHDWAGIVAYASLPADFSRQVVGVQISRARDAINGVLKSADEYLTWLKGQEFDKLQVSEVKSIEDRLDQHLKRLEGSERRLNCLLNKPSDSDVEVYSALATTWKRKAQILHGMSKLTGAPKSDYAVGCRAALQVALKHYAKVIQLKPSWSWPIHQVLCLSLALGKEPPEVGDLWLRALMLAEIERQHGEAEQSYWSHTDSLELYLIANCAAKIPPIVEKFLEELGPQERSSRNTAKVTAIEKAKWHARELLHRKSEFSSFAIESVKRQLSRYPEWFVQLEKSLFKDATDAEDVLKYLVETDEV